MTVGVILWPIVFVMTDIINEYFGPKGVRLFSYIAAFLVAYAFLAIYMGIKLSPANFWIDQGDHPRKHKSAGACQIFGQGLWIIIETFSVGFFWLDKW